MFQQGKKLNFVVVMLLLMMSGCAGKGLRGLVTRSDYKTLEELEAADAEGSKEKEASLASADTPETEKQRRSIFNLAGWLNRKGEEADFTDPFVDVESEAAEEVTTAEAAVEKRLQEASAAAANAANEKARQYNETLSTVEKKSNEAFEELSVADLVGTTEAKSETADDEDKSTMSFSEFVELASTEESKTAAPSDPKAAKTGSPEPKTVAKQESAFDLLLGGTNFEEPVAAREEKTKDPVAEAFFAEALGSGQERVSDSPFADGLKEDEASAEDFLATTAASETAASDVRKEPAQSPEESDPFSLAAERHGFGKIHQRDPWAAFGAGKGSQSAWSQTESNTVSTASLGSTKPRIWNTPSTLTESEEASPAFDAAVSTPEPAPSFSQVSQSSELPAPLAEVPMQVSGGLEIPNVIPATGVSSQPSTVNPVGFEEDPFLTVASPADALEEIIDDPALAEIGSAAAPDASTDTGWSTRTWILLLGCLIVLALLFMPERQNPAKSQNR